MKIINKYSVLIVVIITIIVAMSCQSSSRPDTESSSSQDEIVNPEIVFENEYTKVVKAILSPGDVLGLHHGESRVIYSLTDYSIDWEEGGEDKGTKSWEAGDVHFHEAGQHSAINSGTTVAKWLAFIKKDADLPDCAENTLENDVTTIAPEFSNLIFDNDLFRIVEVTLPQSNKIPMHSGINRIIYSISNYKIKYESDREGLGEKEFEEGDVHWHGACQHSVENIGEGDARFLVVSFKS